ncbi:hypothetical protein CYY_006528 [Polysphondylium violaceum]|uniref:Phosphatidylinositol-glycan-specific phospholipase D n=1 Tax=Polysphondylium violaceum TaxID=133409 RepID=A0A8J4V320_9MYCE|nr:hypothetical protein CYY_006528 [Polysphondylium violaceum]
MTMIRFNNHHIFYFVLIFIVTLLVHRSHGCGMTTHNTVGRRAFNFSNFDAYPQYKEYISSHFDAFDAGTAFPDFGYDCAGLANESEAAHWPPFLRAGTEYLLKTYPQPWNIDGIRLAVFLIGITSHQIADIPWHSIGGIQEGLIRAMAGQDFNGTYSTAHSNADEGGEFVLAYNYNLDWLADTWYVPIEDMKNIFHLMNYTRVDSFNLLRCNAMLYAGAMGVKMGGRFLYPEIAKKSPFLVDHYQDYFEGGLDDMAIWTSYCWPVLIGWMQGDPIKDFCFIQPDPNNQMIKEKLDVHRHKLRERSKLVHKTLGSQLLAHIETKQDGKGYRFSLPKDFQFPFEDYRQQFIQELNLKEKDQVNVKLNNNKRVHKISIQQQGKVRMPIVNKYDSDNDYGQLNDEIVETNFSSIYSASMYSYFGREVKSADLNNDGLQDIIVSSPGFGVAGAMQTGCVYYIISNRSNSNSYSDTTENVIDDIATGKVCNNETHSKFGWDFEILDFNLDGILDVLIGAPSASNADLLYKGAVYVYLGQHSGVNGWTIGDNPSLTINGYQFHDSVGSVIKKGDCNGDGYNDLILGLPNSSGGGSQRGMVAIFYSSTKYAPGQVLNQLDDSDYKVYGDNDYEWFGYDVKVQQDSKKLLLIVGSPNYHTEESPMNIGKLTAYPFENTTFGQEPVFTILGCNENDKLGYSFSITNGSSINIPTLNNVLTLSLPTRGFGGELDQVGEVILIDLDPLSGQYTIDEITPLLSIKGSNKYSRFGESLLFGKLKPENQFPNLFVGAPLWTDSIDTGPGCVFAFSPAESLSLHTLGTTVELNESHSIKTIKYGNLKSSGASIFNKRRDSRFGFRMALADLNHDGTYDLVVGADRDSSKTLEGGSINIFIS